MDPVISSEHLVKVFRRRKRSPGLLGAIRALAGGPCEEIRAVNGLSLEIGQGESVGLIGENGAGKSTTIKLLTGIIAPTAGDLRVLGRTPWRDRRRLALDIGVVFGQRPQLLWDIPVRETFRLLKDMYGVSDEVYRRTAEEAIERLELGPLLATPVRQLSLGQRMRCDLAAAFLHAPTVVFLDEPTIGLDVSVKEEVREYIRDMQERFGSTLIITTHDLKDITEIARRLVLLDKGRLLFDGSLDEFERQYAEDSRIVAELHAPPDAAAVAALKEELAGLCAELEACEARRLVVSFGQESTAAQVIPLILKRARVADLILEKPDIETLVRRIYREPETGS